MDSSISSSSLISPFLPSSHIVSIVSSTVCTACSFRRALAKDSPLVIIPLLSAPPIEITSSFHFCTHTSASRRFLHNHRSRCSPFFAPFPPKISDNMSLTLWLFSFTSAITTPTDIIFSIKPSRRSFAVDGDICLASTNTFFMRSSFSSSPITLTTALQLPSCKYRSAETISKAISFIFVLDISLSIIAKLRRRKVNTVSNFNEGWTEKVNHAKRECRLVVPLPISAQITLRPLPFG
mmetsp:Transcript_19004/g.48516  ORF Transcript_19004/g.48516 Transcript_19004/m.48516 type:complete len:237 (+) Transcript_19004:2412-3122(+)